MSEALCLSPDTCNCASNENERREKHLIKKKYNSDSVFALVLALNKKGILKDKRFLAQLTEKNFHELKPSPASQDPYVFASTNNDVDSFSIQDSLADRTFESITDAITIQGDNTISSSRSSCDRMEREHSSSQTVSLSRRTSLRTMNSRRSSAVPDAVSLDASIRRSVSRTSTISRRSRSQSPASSSDSQSGAYAVKRRKKNKSKTKKSKLPPKSCTRLGTDIRSVLTYQKEFMRKLTEGSSTQKEITEHISIWFNFVAAKCCSLTVNTFNMHNTLTSVLVNTMKLFDIETSRGNMTAAHEIETFIKTILLKFIKHSSHISSTSRRWLFAYEVLRTSIQMITQPKILMGIEAFLLEFHMKFVKFACVSKRAPTRENLEHTSYVSQQLGSLVQEAATSLSNIAKKIKYNIA